MMVKVVLEELDDAAFGTATGQGQTERRLFNPRLGDGQPEEKILGHAGWGSKGFIESVLSFVGLFADEFAADPIVPRGLAGSFFSPKAIGMLKFTLVNPTR